MEKIIKERKIALIIGNSEYQSNSEYINLPLSVYDTRFFVRFCK